MAYTHRTLLRHLLVALVLLAFPFVLAPPEQVWWWYQRHWFFFVLLFLASAVLGFESDLWVRQGSIKTRLEKLRAVFAKEDFAKEEAGFYWRILLLWASCSRCVSWWLGGLVAFFWSVLYWEWREVWWQNWILWFLFSSLGASFAATVSVGVYFFRRRKKSS